MYSVPRIIRRQCRAICRSSWLATTRTRTLLCSVEILLLCNWLAGSSMAIPRNLSLSHTLFQIRALCSPMPSAETSITEHPHGLSDRDFDSLVTQDRPVSFNFHGYPWLIHKFTYRRTNHASIHVRGYKEKGNINTPLELAIRNQVDRFNLAIDVIDRIPKLQGPGAHLKEWLKGQIIESTNYADTEGIDKPEIRHWK